MPLQHEIQVVLRRCINKRCNLLITFKQHRCTAAVSLNPQPSPPHNPDICTKPNHGCTDPYSHAPELSTPLCGSRSIFPPLVWLCSFMFWVRWPIKFFFFLVQFQSSWLLEFESFDSACQKLWFIDRNACDNRGKKERLALHLGRLHCY